MAVESFVRGLVVITFDSWPFISYEVSCRFDLKGLLDTADTEDKVNWETKSHFFSFAI